MIDSAGFLWSYVIELRECKARSNELVDPCTICVYIVAIWCSAAYIQGAVRSQAVIYAANIDPSGSHVAFRIEIVPFSICFLPLGCRVGTIWILPPPADAVSSFLPAFWEGVGIIVIGSVGAWGPGAGRYPFALCVVAGFYGTYFKGVFGTCAYPAGKIIAGSIYGNSGSGTIWRCYQVTVFIQLYLEIFGRRNIAPGCSTFRGSAPFYTAWCSRIAHISIFIKYKADVQDDGSARRLFFLRLHILPCHNGI